MLTNAPVHFKIIIVLIYVSMCVTSTKAAATECKAPTSSACLSALSYRKKVVFTCEQISRSKTSLYTNLQYNTL